MDTSTMNGRAHAPGSAPVTTVAGYLLTRLTELGVISVFGVPGDHNLGILDAVADRTSMAWIGTATEQGAGYAADSYARLRGVGALVTTFGAGELSAMNAIAGSCAESVPVVHIVGTPALTARTAGVTLHHNLPGTDFGHFARMAAEVTAAQADLRADTAPAEIDRVLRAAVRHSQPVYLAIPSDVASAPVPAPAGPLSAFDQREAGASADPTIVAMFTARTRQLLSAATRVSVLVGHLAGRHGADVRDLAAARSLPVAVDSTAKGDFPESDPLFAGLYAGGASSKRARLAVEDTDVLITVGVTPAGTATRGGTNQLPEAGRIDLAPGQARIGGTVYPGIGLRQSLAIVTEQVRASLILPRADLAELPAADALADAFADASAGAGAGRRHARLTQAGLWASLQDFLLPGDLVVADQGTAFYGAVAITLPDGARLAAQPLWDSAGWALPAALGASLAAPGQRVVLITGDGGLQRSAGELGTLLAQGLAPVVIVLSNGGHTAGRIAGDLSAAYHDIPAWDLTALPRAVGRGSSPLAVRARTPREFDAALRAASQNAGRPILIEAVLRAYDAPPLLRDLIRATAPASDYDRS